VGIEPSDEELRAFAESLLSNLDNLSDPAVIDEAIRERRDMWVLLYRAGMGFEVRDAPS
jgi:hypothetical protein